MVETSNESHTDPGNPDTSSLAAPWRLLPQVVDFILPQLVEEVALPIRQLTKPSLLQSVVDMLKTIFKCSLLFFLLLAVVACEKAEKSPPEIRLSPDPATIDHNGTFTMSWEANSVDYCIASGDWTGNIKRTGSKILGPLSRDSIYILDCFFDGNKISDSVMVKVRPQETPRVDLTASPLSIAYRDSTTIRWSSQHVTDCMAAGDWSGPQALSGTLQLEALETDSEFRLICSGPKGEVSDSVSIDVFEAGITVPRVDLTAAPELVSYKGSTTLSWNTEHADICRASGNWFGSKARSGMETIKQLTSDSHFILTCTIAGGGGGEGIDAAEVRVNPPPPPVVKLTASAASVHINGSVTLLWSSSHADSCIATGDWYGTRSISGTRTIGALKKDSTFSLNCNGAGGLGSDTVTISLLDGDT